MYTKKTVAAAILPALAAIVAVSCRQSEARETPNGATQASVRDVSLPVTDGVQLVVAPEGNEVRYRVREQLVGFDLPNDAVGATSDVSGEIGFDAAGKLVPSSSKFTVNIATLKSDKDRRDGYVRGRILEANQYPTVEFVPTTITGLTSKIPSSGTQTLTMAGNLTVRGVTKPTTWKVDAKFDGGRVTGNALTSFRFADFGLTQPRVPVVLSVADTITLEYTFALVQKK